MFNSTMHPVGTIHVAGPLPKPPQSPNSAVLSSPSRSEGDADERSEVARGARRNSALHFPTYRVADSRSRRNTCSRNTRLISVW